MDIYTLLQKYKQFSYCISVEEQRQLKYEYIYYSNKLEGNQLSLAQVKQFLKTNCITGRDIEVRDLLECVGMENAYNKTLGFVIDKVALDKKFLLKLNTELLKPYWEWDRFAYYDFKKQGQQLNSYKMTPNIIQINEEDSSFTITPLSSISNVDENMNRLIDDFNSSEEPVIKKVAHLAYQIWLHQPFLDGNKRTGRLLISHFLFKEGFPLFVFDDLQDNYNQLLINQYKNQKEGLIEQDYLMKEQKWKNWTY